MKIFRFIQVLVLAALLTACAGLQAPRSAEDALRYQQSGISAAYRTIGDLKASKVITAAEGRKRFDQVASAEEALDAAELALGTGDLSTTQAKLRLAITIMTEVNLALKARVQK